MSNSKKNIFSLFEKTYEQGTLANNTNIFGPILIQTMLSCCDLCPIDLFEEVTKSQASGWVVEAEDYKMPPVPMHFYRLVTLDSFFGHCCFLIIFRSVCLQLIGFSEWELLDKYM